MSAAVAVGTVAQYSVTAPDCLPSEHGASRDRSREYRCPPGKGLGKTRPPDGLASPGSESPWVWLESAPEVVCTPGLLCRK